MNTLWNLLQESRSDFIVRRVFGEVNGDENFLGFCIDITNIDTSFVCEENPITLEQGTSLARGM